MSACYLCGTPTSTGVFVHDATRSRAPWLTIACVTCGLIQHAEHPSKADLDEYYSSGAYRREFPPLAINGVEPGAPGYAEWRRRWASELADSIEHGAGPVAGRHVYEVGAGDLEVAAEMSRRGATVTAIEIDPTLIPDGVTVLDALPENLVDGALLVALQVIEHQDDPVSTIRDWLRADTIFMEMPNAARPYGSLTHFLQSPHVTSFSPRTILTATLMAGATDVAYEQNGTVLAVRARGRGERRSYADVTAMFASPFDGVSAARELRGAFGL